jgi:glycosyltransferase involved in cell wall biosynthesis
MNALRRRPRLAVVLSHPTQYYSPWFRHIQACGGIDVQVFYLWDFGVEARFDRQFGCDVQWDVPLLEGYGFEFVPNRSRDPGTHHAAGLDNPALVQRLSASRPDAILLFGYTYRSHLRVLMSPRLARVPLLLRGDSHDMGRSGGWRQRVSKALRRALFSRITAALAVGQANAHYYRESGVPASRIHFVPHCVDNQRFQEAAPEALRDAVRWRSELGIAEHARVALFAGKFEHKKRPLDLLTAFLQMEASRTEPDGLARALLFVGSGSLEGELRAVAGGAVGSSVFFAPFQNQTAMPMVYAAGDVLVLPSHGAAETWGLAVNEAMNLERPAIVSSHVGCGPDLVQHGRTGWVFEAGNLDALRAALSEALALDAERLREMGRLARARVDGYSYEAATAGLQAALRSVLPTAESPSLDGSH